MALIDELPDYFKSDPQAEEIQAALDTQLEAVKSAKSDVFLQLFVDTATWGLKYWENALGVVSLPSATYAQRRARIKERLLARGSTTVEVVRKLAETYSGGAATVTEHPGEYWFDIDTGGLTAGFADALEEVKPAHLMYGEPPPWYPCFYGAGLFNFGFYGG